jgi:nucleotidyltransferase/DNA polymerase involved in DNA repair
VRRVDRFAVGPHPLVPAFAKRAVGLLQEGLGLGPHLGRLSEKIKTETGLNASAGISYNKFLAKLASAHRKPNGEFVISPEMGPLRGSAAGRQIPWDRATAQK